MKYITLASILCFALAACSVTHENEELLINTWTGVAADGAAQAVTGAPSSYIFDFKDDYTYSYKYGGSYSEEGTWSTKLHLLYAQPNNGTENVVEIKSLTADTLVLKMNRGGFEFDLTLASSDQ